MFSILIAEDETGLRELIGLTLEEGGRRILYANNGQQAIEVAEREQPNLTFMDIRMPVVDGIEATRQIKTNPKLTKIPIIIVTALADQSHRKQALAAGATFYITKPFSPLKLLEIVDVIEQGRSPV